jgi:hypothetical protein
MKYRLVFVLSLCGLGTACAAACRPDDLFAALNRKFAAQFIGQTAVDLTCAMYSPSPPPTMAQALAPGGACAPAPSADDDACVACAQSACCASSLVCFGETACTCRIACRTVGPAECASADAERCGPTDTAYDAVVACLDAHCAEQCAPAMP